MLAGPRMGFSRQNGTSLGHVLNPRRELPRAALRKDAWPGFVIIPRPDGRGRGRHGFEIAERLHSRRVSAPRTRAGAAARDCPHPSEDLSRRDGTARRRRGPARLRPAACRELRPTSWTACSRTCPCASGSSLCRAGRVSSSPATLCSSPARSTWRCARSSRYSAGARGDRERGSDGRGQ